MPGLDRLLAGKGFAIRSCENYRRLGPGDYRIAVRTGEENEALLQALDELEKSCNKERQEKVWQKSDDSGDDVQCGKSILTAGILRVLYQDGYRVAPFKSQNMALNSYITRDGLEMGRAQVMQAEAAGIEPDIRMNPILLKPNSDMGSQVIVNGEVLGNREAKEYFRMKKA